MQTTARKVRIRLPLQDTDLDLEQVDTTLRSEFNVDLLKIIQDALASWDFDYTQPGISEVDRIISHIPASDFYEWYRASVQLTRIAEHIQALLKERLEDLLDHESQRAPRPLCLTPVRYLKGVLILDIDGIAP